MPMLDGADLFRSCQLETHDGVNAFHPLSEDSVYQYSRAQIERTNKARQWIDQKTKKQNTVEDKDQVDATISEDLADGQTAKLDASLKLLGDDDIELLIPSDDLDDDEIHIIETTGDLFTVPGSNRALQDYQMQLMLLEQQNKKRLLIARQKQQDALQPHTVARQFEIPTPVRGLQQDHIQTGVTRQSSRHLKATKVVPTMPANGADKGTIPATTKRQKRDHATRSQASKTNIDCDAFDGIGLGVDCTERVEGMPPHFDVIYSIKCAGGRSRYHHVPAFRDVPAPHLPITHSQLRLESNSDSDLHINGTVPIFDLEALMEDDTDGIAFVVIRTVECSEALVLKVLSGGPLRFTEAIYAKSKIAINALQQITTCYFQTPSDETKASYYGPGSPMPREETAQYRRNCIDPADLFFFHHRDAIRTYPLKYPESKLHLGALLEYVDDRYGKEFAEAESLFAAGLVTQAHISKLFKPNALVISGTYGRPAAFVVLEWPKVVSEGGWLTLTCWSFQNDGTGFARKQSVLSILPIESKTTRIQDLPVYPLQYAAPELRELIRARGEKQWAHRTTTQVTYKGWNVKADQYFPDARFMIDHKIYRKMHEFAQAFRFDKPKTTHPYDRMPAYLNVEQQPSDTDFLLMPPDIHGFYLNEKKWVKLFVDCVHPVSWNKIAYDRLVLPDQTKDLVRALVTVRTSQRGVKQGLGVAGKRTDITSGKGNGLIMLLHGGPGTGKTLTAESVAEIAEMPLYRVTCGDIGTNAEAVEKYLNTVLHLGKTWNCVLLLDEADVFLEERSMADLKRNSLVSVFLRILEYYDGILILTSNRVGLFDEAFKSRIQVALHYENLKRPARKKIWQNFMEMLEEDEEDVNFDEIRLHLDDLAGKELNGRQIRNVLTTARQLAIFRNQRLDWEHLEQALSVSSDFTAYLKRMQGHTDDQRARDIGLR